MTEHHDDGPTDLIGAPAHRSSSTAGPASTAPPAPVAPPARSHWPLAIALVFIVLILCGTGLAWWFLNASMQVPADVVEAVRPTVNVSTIYNTAFEEISDTPKLVVWTGRVNAEIAKQSETRVLWGKLYLGTTVVRVRAADNRVQYIVPLDEIKPEDLIYEPKYHRLIVRIPAPELDTQVVEVQSDPAKLDIETANGWAKLDRFSGHFLREEAMADLRPAVVRQGRNPLLAYRARDKARTAVADFIRKAATPLDDDVLIHVEFKDED